MKKKITFSEEESRHCTFCGKLSVVIIIDMAKVGTAARFCEQHLKEFCRRTLEKIP